MYNMGTTNSEAARKAKSRRLLKRFQEAVSALAFKGTCHPDEHAEIELEYKLARKAILKHMNEV